MICPLCCSDNTFKYFEKPEKNTDIKTYFQCKRCELVFVDPGLHLSSEDEKSIYDFHENGPENEGYVLFLKRLADPLSLRLKAGAIGLDFGCGPGPTLSGILGGKGFEVYNYDPYYFPDKTLLNTKYDFVTSTETVEHFYSPGKEFLRIAGLLKEKGSFLGVMTQMLPAGTDFKNWWYHRDPTHVSIYNEKTFLWISEWMGWNMEILENGVVIYSK